MPSSRSCRLYVGNINHKVRPREVEKLFKDYGEVIDFDFKDRGQQVNFCFVEYRRASEAELAVENLSGRRLSGAPLIVEPARDRNEKKSGSHFNSFDRNNRAKKRYDSESSKSRSRSRGGGGGRSRSRSRSRSHSRSPSRSRSRSHKRSGRTHNNGHSSNRHRGSHVKSRSHSKSNSRSKTRSRSRKRPHSPRHDKSGRSKHSRSNDSKKH